MLLSNLRAHLADHLGAIPNEEILAWEVTNKIIVAHKFLIAIAEPLCTGQFALALLKDYEEEGDIRFCSVLLGQF